jgi:hypothetical protein
MRRTKLLPPHNEPNGHSRRYIFDPAVSWQPIRESSVAMSKQDAAGMPDGREGIRRMGWIPLPYSCVGLIRKSGVGDSKTIWSWLVLMPWSSDAKPWIDGTEVVKASTLTEAQERDQILDKMRAVLDERYGETVGNQAVDDLIRRLQEES